MKINAIHKKGNLKYYKTSYVNRHILDYKIDYSIDRVSNIELQDKYTNLGLRYYKSKEEFVMNNNFKKDVIDEYWRQYQYRDELIARGQYSNARNKIYVDNIMKGIDRVVGDDDNYNPILDNIRKNLTRLKDNKIVDLFNVGGINKNAISISAIYGLTGTYGIDDNKSLELDKEFERAFKAIGENYIPYIEDYGPVIIDNDEHIISGYDNHYFDKDYERMLKRRSRRKGQVMSREQYAVRGELAVHYSNYNDTIKAYVRALRSTKEYPSEVIISSNRDIMLGRIAEIYQKHTDKIVTSKSGRRYIRFMKRTLSDSIIANIDYMNS